MLPGIRLEISIFAHFLKLLRCKLRCQNDLFSFSWLDLTLRCKID